MRIYIYCTLLNHSMYVSKYLFLTNSVFLLAVYQILSESVKQSHTHFSLISMTFPFWVMTTSGAPMESHLDFALCHAHWPKHLLPVGALEGLKLFFDSMSIQVNQQDKTLSPVRPWQCCFGHFGTHCREHSLFIEYGLLKFIQSARYITEGFSLLEFTKYEEMWMPGQRFSSVTCYGARHRLHSISGNGNQ